MAKHVVNQGECLASIAKMYGFRDWKAIYDHPENSKFRKNRPSPNILFPGDEIFILEKQLKTETCSSDQRFKFKVKTKRKKTLLRLRIVDGAGQLLEGKCYTLKITDASGVETNCEGKVGETGYEGFIEQEIEPDTQHGHLVVWASRAGGVQLMNTSLKIGYLDPAQETTGDMAIISGIQARLNNLGFSCGNVDGILGPITENAIMKFQDSILHRINPDGKPDKETRNKLIEVYGL